MNDLSTAFNKNAEVENLKIEQDKLKISEEHKLELKLIEQRQTEDKIIRQKQEMESKAERERLEAYRLASGPRLDREGQRNIEQEMKRFAPIAKKNIELQDRQAAMSRDQADRKEIRQFLDKALGRGGGEKSRWRPSERGREYER